MASRLSSAGVACGAFSRLTEGQREELAELLAAYDAEDFGFTGKVWSRARVAKVIRWQFGGSYHPAHVSRILRGRTYAPVGQITVLSEKLSHDHLSVMSAITPEGKLLMMEQEKALKGKDVVRFLKHVLREMPGKPLIVWGGSPIHHSKVVKQFLADGGAARIQSEQLPGYAPDLNPDAGIWKHLKHVVLKNVCCQDLRELKVESRRVKERLSHKKYVILGCIRQPGFKV